MLQYYLSQLIGDKVKFALESGLNVIACIGEDLAARELDRTKEVVCTQLKAIAGE